jgi:hypothetical protein
LQNGALDVAEHAERAVSRFHPSYVAPQHRHPTANSTFAGPDAKPLVQRI